MATVVIGAVVALCLGAAGYSVYRSKKKGAGCGCGCEGCNKGKSGNCH